MPRLSLYKPEKGNDYKFIDKQIYEQFQIGGTDMYIHKYIGPQDPANPNEATTPNTIQDVLFLENRDRKYDSTVYRLRGIYNVQDIDFNLSQFGLFLQNDTIFLTVHINSSIETLGRKPMSGDVIELPHLKDDFALNDFKVSLKRFFVIEDINRAAEGFSVTWYPHLYRLKLKTILDSQEFKDILDLPQEMDNYVGVWKDATAFYEGQVIKHLGKLYTVITDAYAIEPPNLNFYTPLDDTETLRYVSSVHSKEMDISNGIIAEAEASTPLSGYNTRHFYTLNVDDTGTPVLSTIDDSNLAIDDANTVDAISPSPPKIGYSGYLIGDGYPANGAPYGFGLSFPENAADGDFFLRTDYLPTRLFRYDGRRWIKVEDGVRMTKTQTDVRETQKTSFINNTQTTNFNLIQSDTFTVAYPKTFAPSDATDSIDIMSNMITTKIPYDIKLGIDVFVNDHKMVIASLFENNGKLACTTSLSFKIGDIITWKAYGTKIEQRTSLSKALKPRADF
jgi:hypothetical protein